MLRRHNRRRNERPALAWPAIPWHLLAGIAAVLVVAAGGYYSGAWLLNRPIETIRLSGPFERVPAIQLGALVEPYARAGFLEVDLAAARRELTALPWVADAEVRRRFPGTLEVQVSAVNVVDLPQVQALVGVLEAGQSVTGLRSTMGAIQNRLEFTMNSLAIQQENMSASESAIRDADIARETILFTRNQILVNAGTTILAQANVIPQSALQLLG